MLVHFGLAVLVQTTGHNEIRALIAQYHWICMALKPVESAEPVEPDNKQNHWN